MDDMGVKFEKYKLVKKMLADGYKVEDIIKLVGMSYDELELYLNTIDFKGDIFELINYNEDKKAM